MSWPYRPETQLGAFRTEVLRRAVDVNRPVTPRYGTRSRWHTPMRSGTGMRRPTGSAFAELVPGD
ncbi:MAG UNVERIFIED_CONTAM: hypothetical protein LVR18_28230 [Planctomycetaceae bacterium]